MKGGLAKEKDPIPAIQSHEVDRNATVDHVIKRIKSEFPTATADQTKFLQRNKQFVTTLHKMRNNSKDLDKFFDKTCPICEEKLVRWPHKTKDSYVISLCEIMKIKYEARFCTRCKFLSYFDLYRVGLVPVRNKVMLIYFIFKTITQKVLTLWNMHNR